MAAWGPTALLPIFQILGSSPETVQFSSLCDLKDKAFDNFSRISVEFQGAVGSAKVGAGAKSEGSLVVSGTKGLYTFLLLGGKRTTLKFATKIHLTTVDISTNWMEREFDLSGFPS